MKVLLLSCSTGGGHDSAAKALMEKFNELGVECGMIDSIELTSQRFSRRVNKLYIDIVNNRPNLFKRIYRMGELYGKLKIKSPVYGINALFKKNLREFIISNNFDLVIATHLFPAETLTSIKKKYPHIHFLAVATDYTCIPFWEETNPDYFIIPSQDLKDDFIRKGIPEDKLLPFGIPTLPKFEYKFTKEEARKQLSLPLDKKIVLIMTGSMGYGNINNMIDKILNTYNKEVHIVVICGNNKKLKNNLEKRYAKKIDVRGYTNNINVYMDACDVILTKPGGLTSTETAVKNVPTIFTDPIPGCENYNANFFKERNMAFCTNNGDNLLDYLYTIFNDKKKVKEMQKNQSYYINKKATTNICEFAIKKFGK